MSLGARFSRIFLQQFYIGVLLGVWFFVLRDLIGPYRPTLLGPWADDGLFLTFVFLLWSLNRWNREVDNFREGR